MRRFSAEPVRQEKSGKTRVSRQLKWSDNTGALFVDRDLSSARLMYTQCRMENITNIRELRQPSLITIPKQKMYTNFLRKRQAIIDTAPFCSRNICKVIRLGM